MGKLRVLSGSGCWSANRDGSLESMCTVVSCGEGMVIVRGKVGKGIIGCRDGGGILRLRWFVMAASMILTAVSSTLVMVGVEVGVVMIVSGKGRCQFFVNKVVFLYVFGHSIGHRV